MPSVLPAARYYPRLSEIITVDDLPEFLSFVQEGLNTVFNKIHYKNFQYSKSSRGDSAYYSLDIVSRKKLQIALPFDIALVLNPDFSGGNSNISAFPVTLEYQWEILAFLKSFQVRNFSFTPRHFYNIGLDIFRISDEQVMTHIFNYFVPSGPNTTKYEQVIDDINLFYGFSQGNNNLLQLPPNTEPSIEALITAIKQHPGINDAVSLLLFLVYILDTDIAETKRRLHEFYNKVIPEGIENYISRIIVPRARATFALSAALEFPRNLLKPVYDATGHNPYNSSTGTPFTVVPADANGFPKALLKFAEAVFYADTEEGLGYSLDVALTLTSPVQIGNTPFILFIQNLKIDLSKKRNLAEVNEDGRPPEFTGVYIEEALIAFPQFWNHNAAGSTAVIKGRKLIIGTGGLSGVISLESAQANGTALFRLGDPGNTGNHFQLGLTSFLVEFKQGAIVKSEISGYMKIPGLKDANNNPAFIDIKAHIDNNGDIRVTASEADGLQPIGIPGVFSLTLRSVSIGRENDRWYIEASGSLQILVQIPHVETDFLKQPIDIKKLRIYQDGSIEFVGGGIALPTQVHINLGPVSLAMDHMGFHPHEGTYNGVKRQYFCITFDGNLNVGGGSVNVRGDGFEFHFTRDAGTFHSYVRIAGIGIDIKVPANASKEDADVFISGYLAMRHGLDAQGNELQSGPEYQGSVEVHLNKLKIHAKASMIMRPKVPAYIVDMELEIPTPIPLGPTGLGIYGFRGLIGNHYVASKPYIGLNEDDSWFEYLKKKVPPRNKQGIGIEKFDPERKGFSLGVGATIATMGDDGWAFSSKVFIMISLPELLLIEGQANVLHKRLGIDSEDDPPFYAFLILDKNSVQAGIGVNYKLPEGGEILALRGEMQMAFFFSNSTAWYINIGKDLPEDKRIQARLFTLFNAYAYLMISHKGIKAGAGAKFEMQKRFGPVRLGLYAFIDTKGFISFKPIQIGGAIVLGGGVYIRVSRFKIELHVTAGLSAEAPKPFVISGFVTIKIKIVFIKIKIRLEFTWRIRPELNTAEVKLLDPGDFLNLPAGVAQFPFKAINMLTGEAFTLKYLENGLASANPETDSSWNNFVIPMDSYIDVEFKRGVKPYTVRYGGGINPLPQFVEYVAPQQARMPQVKHSFYVENVEIKIWNPNNNTWTTYDPWVALTRAFQLAGLTVNTSNFNLGYWQYNNVPGKYTSLRLLSQSPFAVSNGVPPENFGILSQHILCQGQTERKTCQYWNSYTTSTVFPAGDIIRDRNLVMKFSDADGGIGLMPNVFGVAPSLKIKQSNRVEIFFSEPMAQVELRLSSLNGAMVSLYTKVYTGANTLSGLPVYTHELVAEWNEDYSGLMNALTYDSGDHPVSKIMIEVPECIAQDQAGLFAEYWGTLYYGWLEPGETLPEWKYQQIQQWLSMYGAGEGNPAAIAVYHLCEQWNTFVKMEGLTETEYNVLNYWIQNLCGSTDYAMIFNTLCDMWQTISVNPDEYPFLYGFVFQWQEDYCQGIPGIGEFDTCSLYLHELCWLTVRQWEYNSLLQQNNNSVITTGMNTLSQAINQALPPVWRPDSAYAINVHLRDTLTVGGSPGSNYPAQFSFGFKTSSTLGFFHQTQQAYLNLLNYQDPANDNFIDKSDQYKLSGLRHYIDYQRSYPNADGKILGAKPLYYKTPRLGLFFIKPYVYEFFTRWDVYADNAAKEYQLQSAIMDPVDQPGAPPAIPPEIIGWQVKMGAQSIPVNAIDIETISNILVQGNPNCTLVTNVLNPPTVIAEVQRNYDLRPQKLYNAVYKAIEVIISGNKESIVHAYTFETSRYGNFTEHISSYIRTMTDIETGQPVISNAFFPLTITGSTSELAAINTKLQQIISNTLPVADPLIAQFASVYDRIVSGVLQMEALQAATGTEFNIIKTKNLQTNAITIIGILVKSPEPFNDPKLPAAEMAQTLIVTDQSNNNTQFNIVFAKDNSSLFVTNATLSLPLNTFNFAFKYVKFNGISYTAIETVNVPVNLAQI